MLRAFDFVKDVAVFLFVAVLISGLLQYFQIRKLAKGKQFDLSPIQHRSFELPSSPTVILDQSIIALNRLHATILNKNLSDYHIKAQIYNRQMFNIIQIDVSPIVNSRSRVKITCRPFFRATITDNGANYEYAEELLSFLKSA